jgi:chemotaxis protein MotB
VSAEASGGHGGGHDEEEHEEHVNHEAWVIPYADMVTLLMALFLMLYALSTLDLKKFEEMAQSLNASLGSSSGNVVQPLDGDAGGPQSFDLQGAPVKTAPQINPKAAPDLPAAAPNVEPDIGPRFPTRAERAEQALEAQEQHELARQVEADTLAAVREAIAGQATAAGFGDVVRFRSDPRGLVVAIVSDKVLFAPGSAKVQPAGSQILAVVAGGVANVPNGIAVEGHTDSRPIHTSAYPSNWELSTARATTVLRELVEVRGLPAARVSASGYGDTRPIADNATPQGRAQNRRVELVVVANVPPPVE